MSATGPPRNDVALTRRALEQLQAAGVPVTLFARREARYVTRFTSGGRTGWNDTEGTPDWGDEDDATEEVETEPEQSFCYVPAPLVPLIPRSDDVDLAIWAWKLGKEELDTVYRLHDGTDFYGYMRKLRREAGG